MSEELKLFDGTPTAQKSNEELFEEYIDEGGGYCPFCGHDVLGYEDIDPASVTADSIKREVHCDKCHQTWAEEFKLDKAY